MEKIRHTQSFTRRPIIAIDFDDTIGAGGFPDISKCKLVPNAKYYIDQLRKDLNAEIIIWTCRYLPEHVKDCEDFLHANDIAYDYINDNSKHMTFKPYPKIFANYYVDDRASLTIDWLEIYKLASIKIRLEYSEDQTITDEMLRYFWTRTKFHVDKVNEYANKVDMSYPEHDLSKFKDILLPYIKLTWTKKHPETFPDYATSDECMEVTKQHILTEKHHPEYWVQETSLNPKDRDKSTKCLDISGKMPKDSIIEMCADWCAMADELGSSPFDWAGQVLGVRWQFSQDETKFIYDTLEQMWDK